MEAAIDTATVCGTCRKEPSVIACTEIASLLNVAGRWMVLACLFVAGSTPGIAEEPWIEYSGFDGPAAGKHVVLISGDEEYRSEEALPQLGKILAVRHGFRATVLFAIDPETGEIDPNRNDNIPGLEHLESADLMVVFTRFRDLPDDQMRHIAEYLASGRPVIGIRTATHAFKMGPESKYAEFDWHSQSWPGGFGKQVLGETWVSHHGHHGHQSTRGRLVAAVQDHPILRGVEDGAIWGPTDVYGVNLPLPEDSQPLVLGEVVDGMKPDSPAAVGKKNDPMMPIAWTKSYQYRSGPKGQSFTTTCGAAQDLQSEALRRLLVNACYWAIGLEEKIPPTANVDLVGTYVATPFGFGGFRKGMKPSDFALPAGLQKDGRREE